jgi:glycosyltransferase involved in cell wall biosynthesis
MHYSCPPVVGGVEEIIRQQASLFNRNSHRVKVFVGQGRRFSQAVEVEINPLLGSLHPEVGKAHDQSSRGIYEICEELTSRIYRYLSKVLNNFDVLIAHNLLSMPFNLPLSAALHRLGQDGFIPIISWNHDSPYFYPDYPEHLDTFPWNMLKRAYAGIHYVTITQSRKELFAKLYGIRKEMTVVTNGIDPIGFFQLNPSTVRLIQEQDLFKADFLMVQPSRLHRRKNMELSIRVTRALQDLGIKARLLITGAHDPHEPRSLKYYNELIKLASELNIEPDVLIMAEYVFKNGQKLSADRITLRDLYLIADILFLPSLQEGFGIPLLESGMIRLPIVCSNIPPFKEIGGREVCFFDLGRTPAQIAQKILNFMDEIKPHGMFRKVIKHHAWDNIYNHSLLPLLERVIGG